MKNVTYINAGAGSGKTYRLTETLTGLIKAGKAKPEQVILTTYTRKAANEFKEKAKAFLFNEGLYEEAVQLDDALIGTIHSVCQRMIGKYWFHLGLSPNMGVMDKDDASYYISQSLAELPTDDEIKLLHDFARYFDIRETDGYITKSTIHYDFWQEHLKSIIGFATNYELDDFSRSEEESLRFIRQFVNCISNCDFTSAELKAVIDEHESFLRNRSRPNQSHLEKLRKARYNQNHPIVGTLKDIDSTIGSPKGYGPLAAGFQERMAGLWTGQMIYDKQESYIKLLFNLALRWKENFTKFKQEKNLLDYNDMEKYMRQLMQNEAIAGEISQSYRYLFVDEFQDSSPIQVKIFDALSDLMEHSYWVGDYKQAIYGFRGADIALTKAVVDRVAKKENGCDTDTLGTSWRSLPDIVDVNNAVFGQTFAQVLAPENIYLEQHRQNEKSEESLRYFVARKEGAGVAEHVLKLLHQGANPNEIAVLARANASLGSIAEKLKELKVPCSQEGVSVLESAVYPLVASLLRMVGSSKDALSKATVAYLTEADWGIQQIIETKILNDADALAKADDYLANVPLIAQLMAIRPRLKQQSVASLVESVIIELNLYDVVKKIEADSSFGISCLQTIIATAQIYEKRCVQMNLSATIDGYLSYMEEVKPAGSGDPDGVQLHTYHSCKGLQWKYVILVELNTDDSHVKKAVRREIYGVHAVHIGEPSVENPYPEVFVRLAPWIYGPGTNTYAPEEISSQIEASDVFKSIYQSVLGEANRLFYVGMTRPQDVLILGIEEPKKGGKLLQWPRCIGVDKSANSITESGDWDVFGTGHLFKDYTLTPAELEALEPYGEKDPVNSMALNIEKTMVEEMDACYLSPSKIHIKGEVVAHHSFEQRISFGQQPSDMAVVGDCIHQIFAGMEEVRPAYQICIEEMVGSYGLSAVFADKDAIVQAWKNLTDYLTAQHGAAVKTYHERPFRLHRDGQVITGSMDLVWQTAEGDVLVDFKTCPMGATAILNPESEHYAGMYAGQLDAYRDALQAAGEKVVKRYVYYPVSGLLVEL